MENIRIKKHKCENCGYIGIPAYIHGDEKCPKCLSRYIYEYEDGIITAYVSEERTRDDEFLFRLHKKRN